jgi:hypothetical protein
MKQQNMQNSYVGKDRKFTNLFKYTKLKIAFKTNNSIWELLRNKHPLHNKKYFYSTCSEGKNPYVGQTERYFLTPCNEHLQAFCNNKYESNFPKHLLENQHPIDTIDNTMEILYTTGKGSHLNTTEKYCIYKETKNNIQLTKIP